MKKEYITTEELMTLELMYRVRIFDELKAMWDDHDSNSILVYQKQSVYFHAAYAVTSDQDAWVYIPVNKHRVLIWRAHKDDLKIIKNNKKGLKQKWRLNSD